MSLGAADRLSAWLLLAASLGAAAAMASDARDQAERSVLALPHPGQAEARAHATRAGEALASESWAEAARELELAVSADPLFAPAWSNLAAARIGLCRAESAGFAALIARLVDPDLAAAAQNLRLAARLDCPAPSGEPMPEAAVLENSEDPAPWLALARRELSRGRPLLAAFYAEMSLERGGGAHPSLEIAIRALEQESLLRAALRLLTRHAGEQDPRRAALEDRLAAVAGEARRLVSEIEPLAEIDESTGAALQVLAETLLGRGKDLADVEARLLELVGLGGERRHAAAGVSVTAPSAWYGVTVAGDEGKPLLVLRRFPGDTQLAVFAGPPAGLEAPERWIEAQFSRQLARWQPPWTDGPAPTGWASRRSAIELSLGREGRARVEIALYESEAGGPSLTLLALRGDAGCGADCREAVGSELEALSRTIEIAAGILPAPPSAWSLPLPPAWRAPREHREEEDPWNSHRIGEEILIDLPPGVVATRLGAHNRLAAGMPRADLWFRGAFVDREGLSVRIGNDVWAGSVVRKADVIAESLPAPPDDPEAELVATADLGDALAALGLDGRGRVARYRGAAWEGDWLLLERRLADEGFVIRLPVAEGSESLSLLWIALTARTGASAPAPPIVDLSSQLEIDYRPLDPRESRADPRAGILLAAEAHLPVPHGFRVSMSAGTETGFPVTVRSQKTGAIAVLERWRADSGADAAARRRQANAVLSLDSAPEWSRLRRSRRGETWSCCDASVERGEECALVLVPESSQASPAFLLRIRRGSEEARAWKHLVSLLGSLRYRR